MALMLVHESAQKAKKKSDMTRHAGRRGELFGENTLVNHLRSFRTNVCRHHFRSSKTSIGGVRSMMKPMTVLNSSVSYHSSFLGGGITKSLIL